MKFPSRSSSAALLSLFLVVGCDDADDAPTKAVAVEGTEKAAPAAEANERPGGKLEALRATVNKGAPFEDALAAVEKEMGKSPLQQGEFWNFGEYDAGGACVHMVLVRSGGKVQQVQFAKHEPGSSGFGWCGEMKIDKP